MIWDIRISRRTESSLHASNIIVAPAAVISPALRKGTQPRMDVNLQLSVLVIVVFILGAIFGAIVAGGRRGRSVPPPMMMEDDGKVTVPVKRTRMSMRNPMRTYSTSYDDFKTKKGLYGAVKPKGQEKELEV